MINFIILFIFCWIIALFIHDMLPKISNKKVFNLFWYFTLLWVVFFPIRAWLINSDLVERQVKQHLDENILAVALIISFCFWLSSYLGYKSGSISIIGTPQIYLGNYNVRSKFVYFILFMLAIMSTKGVINMNGQNITFVGNAQNELRTGNGPIFFLTTLYQFAFTLICGEFLHQRRRGIFRNKHLYFLVFILTILLSVFLMHFLQSRRIFAEPIFILFSLYILTKRNAKFLAIFVMFATVFAAPILQIFRYINWSDASKIGVVEYFLQYLGDVKYLATIISSSFEGIDHLAAYLQKNEIVTTIMGKDAGIAWSFNVLLSLVPRVLWNEKPEIYGSVEMQYSIYPFFFENGPATITIPVSYIVDFSYGFGVFIGLIFAFLMGRVFKILTEYIWSDNCNHIALGLSLFVFSNMFNVIRGGSGALQGIVFLALVSVCLYGMRPNYIFLKAFIFDCTKINVNLRQRK